MTSLWRGWVGIWSGDEDPRPLAAARIALGLVILWDLLHIAQLGLVGPLFGTVEAGGWSTTLGGAQPAPWAALTTATPGSGALLWGLMVLAAAAFTAGLGAPIAALVLALAWAQWAWMLPNADRGIDTLCRNVLYVFALSGSGRAWSIDAWWRGAAATIPSWPRRWILLQLVATYFLAGVQKGGASWYPHGDFAALYLVLNDPAIARADYAWAAQQPWFALTQLGSLVTVLFQDSYPLVLLFRYARHTVERGGAWRRALTRYPLEALWIGTGALFHIALAVTTDLGIFPWAMLALYPCWIGPAEWAARPRFSR